MEKIKNIFQKINENLTNILGGISPLLLLVNLIFVILLQALSILIQRHEYWSRIVGHGVGIILIVFFILGIVFSKFDKDEYK